MLLDSFNHANASQFVGCCFSGSFVKFLIFTYLIFFCETKQYDVLKHSTPNTLTAASYNIHLCFAKLKLASCLSVRLL